MPNPSPQDFKSVDELAGYKTCSKCGTRWFAEIEKCPTCKPSIAAPSDESRERLGICQKPHFLGGTTEDRKALKQMPHFQIDGVCRDWEVLVPQPNEPSKQWVNRAGELHDQIHEVAALVNMQGVEIGWAPEDAIPILAEALEKVEQDTRELCAQQLENYAALSPSQSEKRFWRRVAERIRGKGE